MANTEATILADTFQKARDLNKWYLSLLKPVDPYLHWEVNGVRLNNVIWLASHLTWAENFLIIKATGGEAVNIEWLEHYNISSNGTLHDKQHDMRTVLDALKLVHEKAMAHLLTIDDTTIAADNPLGIGFGGIKTNRMMIQHAIRHESTHTGHLGWLCKINKIDTV
ncbi:MAG TPA: DinB family protein [Chitinophagales bacterium]|nr:DinB family protein [Chitinophagales bacterium]